MIIVLNKAQMTILENVDRGRYIETDYNLIQLKQNGFIDVYDGWFSVTSAGKLAARIARKSVHVEMRK